MIAVAEVDGKKLTITAELEDGRIAELSRILGGIDVTDSQREAARDMLKERNDYL